MLKVFVLLPILPRLPSTHLRAILKQRPAIFHNRPCFSESHRHTSYKHSLTRAQPDPTFPHRARFGRFQYLYWIKKREFYPVQRIYRIKQNRNMYIVIRKISTAHVFFLLHNHPTKICSHGSEYKM